jgi:pyridoxine 5'-phosphate synthase PdxJ
MLDRYDCPPTAEPDAIELIEQVDMSAIWSAMRVWTPEQRRANLPALLNAIRRLEMRLMVLRMSVTREIASVYELIKPSRVGVMPDEDENEGD